MEYSVTNSTSTESSDDLVLEVVGVSSDGGDVPVSSHDLLVGGNEVSDEKEDGHDDVLGDGDDVGSSDFLAEGGKSRTDISQGQDSTREREELTATVIFLVLAAFRSMWSDPTPAARDVGEVSAAGEACKNSERRTDANLELLRLSDDIGGSVSRVERSSDENTEVHVVSS